MKKPPPLLIGAALVFWGWQTGFLGVGLLLGLVLEAARWLRMRWDVSDQDFTRVWTFCALLFFATAIYAFTSNEGPSEVRGFISHPNFWTQRTAGTASARTAASLCRWLPMVFFLFVAAQAYSSREGVPLRTVSLILSARWKKAKKLGLALPADKTVDVSFAYFALCLLAASFHAPESSSYFWGVCGLGAWALWSHRSPRFHPAWWAGSLAVAIALAYFGQQAVGRLQNYLGNFNPPWLAGLARHRFDASQNRTELGALGRLKLSGKIVIRLERRDSPPPALLREASYRTFKGRTWYAELLESDFQRVVAQTNETTYLLLDKTNVARIGIACRLAGGKALLPLPSGCGRLDHLTAYILQKSELGAVLEEGPGLVEFDASYGPGATLDVAPTPRYDLTRPTKEVPVLKQIVAGLQLEDRDWQEAVTILSRYFETNFAYSTWSNEDQYVRGDDTPLSRFLLRTHRGHCEYFATAGTLLLREAGIPARYAVGWSVHEGAGKKYVVRQRDAHAWCLVWDKKNGIWHDCDFTPPSWVQAESEHRSPLQFLSDAWSWVTFEISRFRWGQGQLRQYLLYALVPILGLLLFQILWRTRRRRAGRRTGLSNERANWPGLDSEFYELEKKLAGLGLVRQLSEPVSAWLERAAQNPALEPQKELLQEIMWLHYRYRFDPLGLAPKERVRLREEVRELLASR